MKTIPWRRKWQPTPVFLPRETHGQRSLAGYSPWDSTLGHISETKNNQTTGHMRPALLAASVTSRGEGKLKWSVTMNEMATFFKHEKQASCHSCVFNYKQDFPCVCACVFN